MCSRVPGGAGAGAGGSSRSGDRRKSGTAPIIKPGLGRAAVTPPSSSLVGSLGGGRGEEKSPPRLRCGVKRLLVAPGSRDARTGEVNPAPPLPLPPLPPLPLLGLIIAVWSPPVLSSTRSLDKAAARSLEPAVSPVSLLKRLLTFRLLRGLLESAGGCFCRANENGAGSGDDTSIIAGVPGPGVERSAAPFLPSRPTLEGVAALACESIFLCVW